MISISPDGRKTVTPQRVDRLDAKRLRRLGRRKGKREPLPTPAAVVHPDGCTCDQGRST